MRKDVKRARLWLINQLNQRVKRLGGKNAQNDVHRAKNTRKLERQREELMVLKKIDIDDVSKYSLCHLLETENLENRLEKLDSDQRAMLKLATHKLVQNHVVKFREAHPIAIDKLILLIRSLGLKYQKKKEMSTEDEESIKPKPSQNKNKRTLDGVEENSKSKRKKSSASNLKESNSDQSDSQVAVTENGENELEEESEADGDRLEEKAEISESEKDKESEISEGEEDEESEISEGEETEISESVEDEEEDETKIEKNELDNETRISENQLDEETVEASTSGKLKNDNKKMNKSKIVPNKDSVSKTDEKIEKVENATKDVKTRKKITWPEAQNKSIDRKEGTIVIKRFNLDKLEESASLVFEAADDNLFIRKGSKPPPRDSFFMGGVDEDEPVEEDLSRSRPQNQRFNKSSNTNDKFKSDKFANKAPFGKVRHFDGPKSDRHADKFANKAPLGKVRHFGGPKMDKVETETKPVNNEDADSNLHPAWIAKRNQQKAQKIEVNLNAGQGKKIFFGDD